MKTFYFRMVTFYLSHGVFYSMKWAPVEKRQQPKVPQCSTTPVSCWRKMSCWREPLNFLKHNNRKKLSRKVICWSALKIKTKITKDPDSDDPTIYYNFDNDPTIYYVHCSRWVTGNNPWKNRRRCVNLPKTSR